MRPKKHLEYYSRVYPVDRFLDAAAKILAEAIPREEILAAAKGGHSDDQTQ